eukprot:scaffold650_cov407-Prasinococcus_capsulatus_cf.AAC.10
MVLFRYDIEKKPHVEVAFADQRTKQITKRAAVDTAKPVMMHDFAISGNYVILPVHPIEFKPEVLSLDTAHTPATCLMKCTSQNNPLMVQDLVKSTNLLFTFNDKAPSRYGLLKRSASLSNNRPENDDIRWFELPAHMSFHVVNAWDEDSKVVLITCIADKVTFDKTGLVVPEGRKYSDFYEDPATRPHLHKLVFDLEDGNVTSTRLLPKEYTVDFPVINTRATGYKSRWCYMSSFEVETGVVVRGCIKVCSSAWAR